MYDEIIVLFSGRMHLHLRQRSLLVEKGDVLIYPAGMVHEEIPERVPSFHSRFLVLHAGLVPRDLPLVTRDVDGRIRQIVTWIYEDHKGGASLEELRCAVMNLLAELRRLNRQSEDPLMTEMRRFMQTSFSGHLTLEMLANHAGMSKFAFLRKYKGIAGKTPMGELRQIRLQEAKYLLLTTNEPLKNIAVRVGLGDEFQLSKLLKKTFGVSAQTLRSFSGKSHKDADHAS